MKSSTPVLEPDGAVEEPFAPAGDEEDEPSLVEEDPDGERLFDAAMFETEELRLPMVDRHSVTKIQAKFGGGPWLDRSSAADCALIRDHPLGSALTLLVDVVAGPPVPGYTTSRAGDLDVVSLSRKFVVQSVSVAAEHLEPVDMLQLAVRRLLNSGRAIDEVQEIVQDAAETTGAT